MKVGDVLISNGSCVVHTNDAQMGFWAMRDHDPALRHGLERVSQALGEEVLYVESVRLQVTLIRRDHVQPSSEVLATLIYRALKHILSELGAVARRKEQLDAAARSREPTFRGSTLRTAPPLSTRPHDTVVDASNIATQGRRVPSEPPESSQASTPTVTGGDPCVRLKLKPYVEDKLVFGRSQNTIAALVEAEAAWFASEAQAVGALLFMILKNERRLWPYTRLGSWGSSIEQVLTRVMNQGPAFTADVLAACTKAGGGMALAASIDGGLIRSVTKPWLQGSSIQTTHVESLPPDLLRQLEQHRVYAKALLPRDAPGRIELSILLELFRLWPPSRATLLTTEIGKIVGSIARSGKRESVSGDAATSAEREQQVDAERVPSRAGGLLFWSMVSESAGFDAVLSGFPDVGQRVVRRALGRAFSIAQLNDQDPLLALWSHEPIGSSFTPGFALDSFDPEQLHRLVLAFCASHNLLRGALRLGPYGDGWVALTEPGLIVDSQIGSDDLHGAVAQVVRRWSKATGQTPESVHVVEDLTLVERDAISEIEVVALRDRWRPALRLAASALRTLAARQFEARLNATLDWRAWVDSTSIALRQRDASRVRSGLWLRSDHELTIGGKPFRIHLVP